MNKEQRSNIGRRARKSGAEFERKVRSDLESKGWIVSRWGNNVEFNKNISCAKEDNTFSKIGKLIPAKSNRFNLRSTGFPDFIVFRTAEFRESTLIRRNNELVNMYDINGVEVKSDGYLTREEKAKCRWFLNNKIFNSISIAKKGKKRGEIIYEDFH